MLCCFCCCRRPKENMEMDPYGADVVVIDTNAPGEVVLNADLTGFPYDAVRTDSAVRAMLAQYQAGIHGRPADYLLEKNGQNGDKE